MSSKAIRVFSLDYDGCIAEPTLEDIKSENESLLQEMQEAILNGEKVYVCVGSNRQDIVKDRYNSYTHKVPSVYAALPALVDEVKSRVPDDKKHAISFDGMLGIDLEHGKPPGHHYELYAKERWVQEGCPPREKKSAHQASLVDETKVSMLYAQMHRFAHLHEGGDITFVFKDDRADILAGINQFYQENPERIPSNVTLKLEQKLSSENTQALPFETQQIKGSGLIDESYAENSKALAYIADLVGDELYDSGQAYNAAPTDYGYSATEGNKHLLEAHATLLDNQQSYSQFAYKNMESDAVDLDSELTPCRQIGEAFEHFIYHKPARENAVDNRSPNELNDAYARHLKTHVCGFLDGSYQPYSGLLVKNTPSHVIEQAVIQDGGFSRIFDEFRGLPTLSHEQVMSMSEDERYAHLQSLIDKVTPILLNEEKTAPHPDIINALGERYENILEGKNTKSEEQVQRERIDEIKQDPDARVRHEQEDRQQRVAKRKKLADLDYDKKQADKEQMLATELVKAVVASYGQRILETIPNTPTSFNATQDKYSPEVRQTHQANTDKKITGHNDYRPEMWALGQKATVHGLAPKKQKLDAIALAEAAYEFTTLLDELSDKGLPPKKVEVLTSNAATIDGFLEADLLSKATENYDALVSNFEMLVDENPNLFSTDEGKDIIARFNQINATLIEKSRQVDLATKSPLVNKLFRPKFAAKVTEKKEQLKQGLFNRLRGKRVSDKAPSPSILTPSTQATPLQALSEVERKEQEAIGEKKLTIKDLNDSFSALHENIKAIQNNRINLDEKIHHQHQAIENIRLATEDIGERYLQDGLSERHVPNLRLNNDIDRLAKNVEELELKLKDTITQIQEFSSDADVQTLIALNEKIAKLSQELVDAKKAYSDALSENLTQNLTSFHAYILENHQTLQKRVGVSHMNLWQTSNSLNDLAMLDMTTIEEISQRAKSPTGISEALDEDETLSMKKERLEGALDKVSERIGNFCVTSYEYEPLKSKGEIQLAILATREEKRQILNEIRNAKELETDAPDLISRLENISDTIEQRLIYLKEKEGELASLHAQKTTLEESVSEIDKMTPAPQEPCTAKNTAALKSTLKDTLQAAQKAEALKQGAIPEVDREEISPQKKNGG